MTFYFIAGEPSSFFTMVNIAYVIKKINPNHVVVAIVPYHGFLAKMEVQEFFDEFDRVWHLPPCEFQRNIFLGFFRGRAFKKAMKNIVFDENSIAFAFTSMEMSVNLLIKHINEKYKSIKVVLLNFTSKKFDCAAVGGRFSKLLTFLNRLYSFMLDCYHMKSYVDANGQFMYRENCQQLPFPKLVLSDNLLDCNAELEQQGTRQISLPYPSIIRHSAHIKKQERFVVFFGEGTLANFYVQLDKQFLIKKTAQYVNAIRNYYAGKNIKVYYKPHPADGEKLMAGCASAGFAIFNERINAEMLFSKYHDDIVAAYTVCSHSVLFGSKYGIPSYWAYEICFTDEELKNFFRKITSDNKSNLLKSLISLDQIGSIDDNKTRTDMNKIVSTWKNGIQILTGEAYVL